MLGLIIIGIAAVAVAVAAAYKAMSDSKKDADDPAKFSKTKKVGSPTADCPREFLKIEWATEEAWCSDKPTLRGTTKAYNSGDEVKVSVKVKDTGKVADEFKQVISGNAFSRDWEAKNIKPVKNSPYKETLKLEAQAEGKKTPKLLKLNFVANLPNTHYSKGRHHFDLEVKDYVAKLHGDIDFVKGWAGSVVKLGAAAPAGTGGLLDGKLTWSGYRWMKQVGLKKKFWDGTAWKDLPAGFSLIDANNFCVGFYKNGTKYTCQYGGDWPENFTDWNINAKANKDKLKAWEKSIKDTWTGKFHLQRKECKSADIKHVCCKYSIKTTAKFNKKASFVAKRLIIAPGNIRSNDSLFFIGGRVKMAAHEFGHHIGNPDEYAGASVDTSLNSDGAVNGIDADSIMGQNMTKVKKRHFTTVCKHLADMVKTKTGKTYTYEAV